jgi:hypothetical protein
VVESQVIDVVEVILSLIMRPYVVQTSSRNRTYRCEPLSPSEAHRFTTKFDGMWNIGDHKFNEFAEMALFWLFAEAAVNPRVIAEYVFPGSIPGFYTHLEYIKLAP